MNPEIYSVASIITNLEMYFSHHNEHLNPHDIFTIYLRQLEQKWKCSQLHLAQHEDFTLDSSTSAHESMLK